MNEPMMRLLVSVLLLASSVKGNDCPLVPGERLNKYATLDTHTFIFDTSLLLDRGHDYDGNVDTHRASSIPVVYEGNSDRAFRMRFGGRLTTYAPLSTHSRFLFDFEVLGQESTSHQGQLPWPTRVAIAEMSIQDNFSFPYPRSSRARSSQTLPDLSTVLNGTSTSQSRAFKVFFSDARARNKIWRWDWKGSLMAKVKKGQALKLTVTLLDPVEVARSLPRSDSLEPVRRCNRFDLLRASDPANNVMLTFTDHNTTFYANRDILSSRSTYFDALLNRFPITERDNKTVINVSEFSPDVMLQVLRYIHGHAITASPHHPDFLLIKQAALFYGIEHLDMYIVIELIKEHWSRGVRFDVAAWLQDVHVKNDVERFIKAVQQVDQWQGGGRFWQKCTENTVVALDTIKEVSVTLGLFLVFGAIGLGALGFMAPFIIFGWIYFFLAYILPEH
jgi:hypothetical protein